MHCGRLPASCGGTFSRRASPSPSCAWPVPRGLLLMTNALACRIPRYEVGAEVQLTCGHRAAGNSLLLGAVNSSGHLRAL